MGDHGGGAGGLLKTSQIPLYATALREDTVDVRQADLGRAAVVIGSEGRGVSQALLDRAEQTVKIPMRERCESLNAASAAVVVLWENGKIKSGPKSGPRGEQLIEDAFPDPGGGIPPEPEQRQ